MQPQDCVLGTESIRINLEGSNLILRKIFPKLQASDKCWLFSHLLTDTRWPFKGQLYSVHSVSFG
jgi:hypothetical protein